MPKQTFFNLDKAKQTRIFDAAVLEFSQRTYEEVKISNIIRDAKIPRGSFYQYFDDKRDLFMYMFTIIGQQKMEFLGSDLLTNSFNIPFLDLFRKMYTAATNFSAKYPKYIEITNKVMASSDNILSDMMNENKKLGIDLYVKLIDKDKDEWKAILEDLENVQKLDPEEVLSNLMQQAQRSNSGLGQQYMWFYSTGGMRTSNLHRGFAILAGTQGHKSTWKYAMTDSVLTSIILLCFVKKHRNNQ